MCKTGGPRCEYSNKWRLAKRKLERTKKFQESPHYTQKSLLLKEHNQFNKDHSTLFKAHLPAQEKWQTKARPYPRRKAQTLAKLFSKPAILTPTETKQLTLDLNEEYARVFDKLTKEETWTLASYTMNAHADINGYLRYGVNGIETPGFRDDEDSRKLIQARTLQNIKNMDEVFKKHEDSKTPRTLYRHFLTPAGIKPREYAEKYFKLGERVRDPAFMSTSEDPAYIRGHAHARRPSNYVVFQIVSRKGITLQEGSERNGDLQSWEKERLLPRGINLRVVGVRQEQFSIDETRSKMIEQFADRYSKIPPQSFTVVQLIDEDEVP